MASGMPVPRTTKPRPALPKNGNMHLRSGEALTPVKFQPIRKDGNAVIIGRVKIQIPATPEQKSGHAYILRRYDTGFISLSTMWKGAFPTAPQSEEKEELQWVKANFDCTLPPQAKEHMRLAGTWVPIDVARFLAPSYNLLSVITILVNAQPDPEIIAKAHAHAQSITADSINGSAQKSTTSNKRVRKEAPETPTKAPAATGVNGAIQLLSTPGSTSKTRQKTKSPAPPASRTTPTRSSKSRKAPSPAPITPTPALAPAIETGTTPRRSSRIPRRSRYAEVEDDSEDDLEDVKPPLPDPADDIAESQSLVQRLMLQQKQAVAPFTSVKRNRDQVDAPLLLNLDRSQEVMYVPPSERALVTNRRILPQWPTLPQLDSQQKSAVWGTLAFAIGWGAAATLLPQFF